MNKYFIYPRILAYVVTILLHTGNATWMSTRFFGDVMKNAHVKHFQAMQCYFFTCWTFTFQIIYACIALYTDILTLRNSRDNGYRLPKVLSDIRDSFYIVLVWPATLLVFTMFWSFFAYDRNLLYPEDIDLAISSTSNHIMHTVIFFIAMWEMLFRPRVKPASHLWYILSVLGVETAYFGTVIAVYIFKGVYVYPMFGHLIGTIYFYLFFIVVATLLFIIYHVQWILNDLIWGADFGTAESKVEKNKKSVSGNGENSARKVK